MGDETSIIEAKLETIRAEIAGISKEIGAFMRTIQKVVDDHETRLRQAAEVDARQQTEIAQLGLRLNEVEAGHDALSASFWSEHNERVAGERKLWQTVSIEALKIALGAGAGGGVIAVLLRVLGVAFHTN